MKKYIITILSVVLCFAPMRVDAQATPSDCASATGDSCPNGCYNERGSAEETCQLCPAGTYSTNGLYCSPCTKPDIAEFRQGDDTFKGMASPNECPWYITCPENTEIYPGGWGSGTTCTACSTGYYKPEGTTQYWDGTNMTGACIPKTFTIHVRILLPENCGAFTGTASFDITYKTSAPISFSLTTIKEALKSKIDTTKYNYPTNGTTFTLKPINFSGPDIKLLLENSYLVFADNTASGDYKDTNVYPDGQEFNMDMMLLEVTPTMIYYCPSPVANIGITTAICYKEPFAHCDTKAKKLADITFGLQNTIPNCSDGQYVDSWILLDGANNFDWSKGTEVSFGQKITLGSSSKKFYMAPKFKDCAPGTYNDEQTCNATCKGCPDGFSSEIPATQCFINVPLKDKAGMFNLPNRVYYPTDN